MKHVVGFAVWAGQPGGADEYRVAGVGLTHVLGQAKANADVIAAAPDLLEALQSFNMKEQDIVGAQAGHLILRVPMDVIAKMAAAIAKATGGAA